MRSSISPEQARKIRLLFDRVVFLDEAVRTPVLDAAEREDPSLRRDVETLLTAFEHADAVLEQLGESSYIRSTYTGWERLQVLFDRACRMESEDMATLLDQLTAGRSDLRPDLEQLFSGYVETPDLFEASGSYEMPAPSFEPKPAVPPAPSSSSGSDPLVGTLVSRYEIRQRLGKGGMGVVYKARDTSLDRDVALKFLSDYLGENAEAEARFIHEAKAVSALDHPNIAVVHEIDRTADGQLFIVMAYYAGETLREKMDEGPLSMTKALEYALQTAMGLQRAHEKGIIHRDIKPENVMLAEGGQVKIVDFGLAKMQDVNLTRTGTSMGTLAYMSPEQVSNQPVDHRTDLWALGVMLYEMLAGERPFRGNYEAATLYAIANVEPDSIQMRRAEVPEGVAAVVDRLLQKDPDARYQQTADVVHDLRVLYGQVADGHFSAHASLSFSPSSLGGVPRSNTTAPPVTAAWGGSAAPTSTPATTTTISLPLPTARSRWIIGGGVLAVLAVVAAWMVFRPDTVSPEEARQLRLDAQSLEESAIDHFVNGRFTLAQTQLERAVSIDSTYASAWSSLSGVHIRLGNFEEAILDARRALLLDSTNTGAYYNLAFGLEEIGGDLGEAESAYRAAIRLDSTFIQAYSVLGHLLIQQGKSEEALRVLEQALTADPNSELLFSIYKNMGKAYLALDQPQEAINALELSQRRRADYPETIALLAEAYAAIGDIGTSRTYLERYMELEDDPAKQQELRDRLTADR